jgi:hypothetical protein
MSPVMVSSPFWLLAGEQRPECLYSGIPATTRCWQRDYNLTWIAHYGNSLDFLTSINTCQEQGMEKAGRIKPCTNTASTFGTESHIIQEKTPVFYLVLKS